MPGVAVKELWGSREKVGKCATRGVKEYQDSGRELYDT